MKPDDQRVGGDGDVQERLMVGGMKLLCTGRRRLGVICGRCGTAIRSNPSRTRTKSGNSVTILLSLSNLLKIPIKWAQMNWNSLEGDQLMGIKIKAVHGRRHSTRRPQAPKVSTQLDHGEGVPSVWNLQKG